MRTHSLTAVKVLYCLSLAALAGCVSSGAKAPGANAPCKTNDGCSSGHQCLPAATGASGLFCCKDKSNCGPSGLGGVGGGGLDGAGLAIDGTIGLDGLSSKGGAIDVSSAGGVGGGGVDGGSAGAGGSGGIATGGASGIDAFVTGGAGAGGADAPMATGGTRTGGTTGSDGRPLDTAADVSAPDAPGTCSTDQDCPTLKPLCLANQCAKCASDTDCIGRSGPACSTSGLCVACTANSHCKGAAAACDVATSQCVGCTKRSDCSGACQTCSASVCIAVKNQDDPTVCAGTCDATGACKSKQGQTCKSSADCANGLPCADGYCCNRACTGTCEACDVGTAVGTCTTLAANAPPRAGRTACVATDATCAGKCDGNSAACAYATSSTSCGTDSCTGSNYQPAGTCSGGTCNTPNPQSCTNACVVSAGGCVACTPGAYQCLGAQPQKCDSTGTWQNFGSRSCTGSCETCTASASNATCTNVTTPPSGKSCSGTDATCKGYCSGSSAACTYPDTSIACSSSTCASGALTTQYCNGAGACATVRNQSCGGFPCASGSACAISCTAYSTDGCLSGYKCVGGNTCVAATVACGFNGSTTCSTAGGAGCCVGTSARWCAANLADCSGAFIPCNSRAECPGGQFCCLEGTNIDTSWAITCNTESHCLDGSRNFGYYVCDPNGPADCPSGKSCSASPINTGSIPGVYTCQ